MHLPPYTLQEVLLRAAGHPIYVPLLVPEAREVEGTQPANLTLQSFNFVNKAHLIKSIETAVQTDITFLHGTYLSPTGGTRGPPLLFFITDVKENKAQRQLAGQMLSDLKVMEPTDIIMNLHGEGVAMYRSQGLTGDLIDFSGATELSIGQKTSDRETLEYGKQFRANAIFAQASRIVQFARYVSGLPEQERPTIPKILYTSEPLPAAQEVYVAEILGGKILSGAFASAEAGPWACPIPRPIRKIIDAADVTKNYSELVFSRKQMIVEIVSEDGQVLETSMEAQYEGKTGEMVLTSLCRWRNPLVRYRTGDFGSLHPYEDGKGEYILLRFYGRSPITSFFVDGEYIETAMLDERVFNKTKHDVLEWQVIISTSTREEIKQEAEGTPFDWLEFRIVTRNSQTVQEGGKYEEEIKKDLVEHALGTDLKIVVKVVDFDGLIKGRIARKFIKIVDQRPAPMPTARVG